MIKLMWPHEHQTLFENYMHTNDKDIYTHIYCCKMTQFSYCIQNLSLYCSSEWASNALAGLGNKAGQNKMWIWNESWQKSGYEVRHDQKEYRVSVNPRWCRDWTLLGLELSESLTHHHPLLVIWEPLRSAYVIVCSGLGFSSTIW